MSYCPQNFGTSGFNLRVTGPKKYEKQIASLLDMYMDNIGLSNGEVHAIFDKNTTSHFKEDNLKATWVYSDH